MSRCNAVVVANSTADLPGVPGSGKPFLVSCPSCVQRALHAAGSAGQVWAGAGEWFADDIAVAWQSARDHNQRGSGGEW